MPQPVIAITTQLGSAHATASNNQRLQGLELHYRRGSDGVRELLLTNPSLTIHHPPKYDLLDKKTITYIYVIERWFCILPDTNNYMSHFKVDNMNYCSGISVTFSRAW